MPNLQTHDTSKRSMAPSRLTPSPQQMREKVDSQNFAQILVGLQKHRESTVLIAHGLQRQLHITVFSHSSMTPLTTCLGVTINQAKEFQSQCRPCVLGYKELGHTISRSWRSFVYHVPSMRTLRCTC